tara:strand:+ start:147 stop:923 length:777 start_codon:yes stop_codon:yes gene_type:complete
MIICSWNINSVRIRIPLIEKLIKKIKPDIIKLQEIKCLNEEFPDFYKNYNYKLVCNGEKGKYGVAILIRENINFKILEFNSDILKSQARICGIKIEESNLYLINVYTPNGNPITDEKKFNFKKEWLKQLLFFSEKYISNYRKIIVSGDFNVIENKDDVKNFENWQNDALGHILIRKQFRKFLSSGFVNLVRLFYPPGSNYSFWDYQRSSWERNDGLLIDHFLASPLILQNVRSFNFETNFRNLKKPSDHIPIWIELEN